jgi:hypothetical protein
MLPAACTGTLATWTSSAGRPVFLPRLLRRPVPGSLLRAAPDPESTGSPCSMMPRPAQCEQVVEKASMRPVPSFFRVSCTSPSDVTSET